MVERKTTYSDPEANEYNDLVPEGYGQMVGLVKGNPFTRNISIETFEGDILELETERQVVVAVMTDADGNIYCEPYDPEMHGEEVDLQVMDMNTFQQNTDFFEAQPSLNQVKKAGSSKPTFSMNDVWKSRGGDPSFPMPKEVYQKNKLR